MIVALINAIEDILQGGIKFDGEDDRSVLSEDKTAAVGQLPVLVDGNRYRITARLAETQRSRRVGVVQLEAGRHLNSNVIVFTVRVWKVDRVLALRSGEQGRPP